MTTMTTYDERPARDDADDARGYALHIPLYLATCAVWSAASAAVIGSGMGDKIVEPSSLVAPYLKR